MDKLQLVESVSVYVCLHVHVGASQQVESEHTEEIDNNHRTPVIISKHY